LCYLLAVTTIITLCNPQSYIPQCNKRLVCYNCVYDLSIKLIDNSCGNILWDINHKLGEANPDTICNVDEPYSLVSLGYGTTDSFLNVNLGVGNYTLTKTLSVNNIAFEYYLNDYLNTRLCLTKDSFLRRAYQKFDTTQCEQTCETCITKLGTATAYVNKRVAAHEGFGYTTTQADLNQFNADYNTQKAHCEKLCKAPPTGCDAMLEVLKGDVKPGGQYAKYIYDAASDSYLADNSSGNTHSLFFTNNTNLANGFDTTYKNHPYFTNNGLIINGNYKTYANFTIDELIKNWQDTFTNILVTQHPEYCKYRACLEQNMNDTFMDNFMNTETYAEAEARGYFDPVGTTIKDPFFKAGKLGNTILSNFRDRLNNYISYTYGGIGYDVGINIKDIAIIRMFCAGTSAPYLKDDIEFHRSYIDSCADNQNYSWITFRGLYHAIRQKVSDSLSKTTTYKGSLCNNDRVFNNYAIRFPDNTLQDSVGGTIYDLNTITAIEANTQNLVSTNCLNTCKGYIPHWNNKLKGCALTALDSTNVMNELVKVCIIECNEKKPFGASNISAAKLSTIPTPPSTSFNDVLKGINNVQTQNLYIKGICDDIFIEMPKPAAHDYLAYNDPSADTCQCNPAKYNNTRTRFPDTVATYDPKCNNCSGVGVTALNVEAKAAIERTRGSDIQYRCKNCIECCKYLNIMFQFLDDYEFLLKNSTTVTSQSREQYDKVTIFTNYFNKKLGFNLSFQEYIDFGKNCLDTAANFDAITMRAFRKKNVELYIPDCQDGMLEPKSNAFSSMQTTHPNYNRNYNIDTCGCDIIFKAERDYKKGLITMSPRRYIEKTYNCGRVFLNYDDYVYSCKSALTYFSNPNNLANFTSIIIYNPDSTLQWKNSSYTLIRVNNTPVTAPLVWTLHEYSTRINRDDYLYNLNSCAPPVCQAILCNKP
jgi:hypothetical protein